MQQFFEYSDSVEKALKDRKPILALESTLITHGFPYPSNLNMAKSMTEIALQHDVTPAIIAVINGKVKIGLTDEEIEYLVNDKLAVKASTRDLAFVINEKLTAGTTVAATLFCAHYAGIKVFATGGIGGVHRGDDKDISADLIELSRTPLAVIASGAKAILDLEKTLEFIETYSIPVIGYRTLTFPAFYTAATHYQLATHVDSIPQLAKLVKIHWQLGMPSSLLIANPIPLQDEIPSDHIEPIIMEALKIAEEKQITGKDLTPFLLSEVAKATQGESMQANTQLINNNVKIGAMLTHALANI